MENSKPNLEVTEGGLQCDNPKCDWVDKSVTFANYAAWRNKPCPKCGENVLTDADYKNAEALHIAFDFINSLSGEELVALNKIAAEQAPLNLRDDPMFKDTKGLDEIKSGEEVIITVSSHKEIKIQEIRRANNVD